jgi:hypothetical protein
MPFPHHSWLSVAAASTFNFKASEDRNNFVDKK